MRGLPWLGLGLVHSVAHAADLEVCQTGPPCYANLQNAINNADHGDRVWIRAGTYYHSAVVDVGVEIIGDGSELVTLAGNGGTTILDIITTQPVTVSDLTIDGRDFQRCIRANDADLTLSFMTCTKGSHTNRGGGLYAVDSGIEADHVTFLENESQGEGGSMLIQGLSTVTVDDSTISSSRAEAGGGVYVSGDSSFEATRTDFISNDAISYGGLSDIQGGAIAVDSAAAILTACNLHYNTSDQSAGAISVDSGSLTLSDGTLTGNGADDSGGAISANGSTLSLTGTLLDQNWTTFGGGAIDIADGSLYATDAVFQGNLAYLGNGGAIRVEQLAEIDLVNTTFSTNIGTTGGGAVAVFSATSLFVSGGLFQENASFEGGAIHLIDDGLGRIYEVDGTVFEANDTSYLGGGGGAILHRGSGSGSTLEIRHASFSDHGSGGGGGALSVSGLGNLLVEDSDFVYNFSVSGGAISAVDSTVNLTRNHFCQNIANVGGAVHAEGGEGAKWLNNRFTANLSFWQGGAGSTGDLDLELLNNTLAGNSTYGLGGALYVNGGTLDFRNNLTMATWWGDGVWLDSGSIQAFSHNAWWLNNASDTNVEPGLRLSDIVLQDLLPPVRDFTGDCEDDLVIEYGGDLFDAGDPSITDPDGSPSDIGAYGGPDADAEAWADEDSDGIAAMWDCNDDDPGVGIRQYWYRDNDGDGWGEDADTAVPACEPPDDGPWVNTPYDCNDQDPTIHPEADEWCDEVDSDCDGETAEPDAIDAQTWYPDRDGDGWGTPTGRIDACDPPEGHVDTGGDCDDNDDRTHPEASEIWYDGVDQACDGGSDFDQDLDGYDSAEHLENGDDCDDGDPDIHPGSEDTIGDAVDQDCNGVAANTWMNGGGGCGCTAAGSGRGAHGLVLLLAAAFVSRRRRRQTEEGQR